MALIHEPGPAPQPDLSAALVRIYGLSKAEARLCRALLDGQSAQEAAVTLNVSHNTIKTHLAGIFQKTGVHSQTALLQLLTKRSRTLT
jgi:DNA-binding CsgD family transcriptional regulator